MYNESQPESNNESANPFEIVDQIEDILKENKNGMFQPQIEELYLMALYLTYCYEADQKIHFEIYEPLYEKFSKTGKFTDSAQKQFNQIKNLLDQYRQRIVQLDKELDMRAIVFAKDCLSNVIKSYDQLDS